MTFVFKALHHTYRKKNLRYRHHGTQYFAHKHLLMSTPVPGVDISKRNSKVLFAFQSYSCNPAITIKKNARSVALHLHSGNDKVENPLLQLQTVTLEYTVWKLTQVLSMATALSVITLSGLPFILYTFSWHMQPSFLTTQATLLALLELFTGNFQTHNDPLRTHSLPCTKIVKFVYVQK